MDIKKVWIKETLTFLYYRCLWLSTAKTVKLTSGTPDTTKLSINKMHLTVILTLPPSLP
jgi:hypothetical protein